MTSLDLLAAVRSAQNQYGLRYDDYARYRKHCTKKIYRLRTALEARQGSGNRFEKKPLEETALEMLTAEGNNKNPLDFLWLILYETERVYAFAMEAKAQSVMTPRKKFLVQKKLKRASQFARILERVCANGKVKSLLDGRSVLEVQAYHAWIDGLYSFETQRWEQALDQFAFARTLYGKLAETGNAEQEALCHARMDDIDPNIRYCAYNLQRQGQDLGLSSLADVDEIVQSRTRGQQSLEKKMAV